MQLPINCVVAIVDDNSEDKTQYMVEKAINKYSVSSVRLCVRSSDRGRGSAVWHGFTTFFDEGFDYFVEMDADFSHSPNDLLKGLRLARPSVGMLIGSRYNKGKIEGWPVKRRLLSLFANLLARVLIDSKIKDYTNGYRIYSSKTVHLIKTVGLKNGGFIALSETIAICLANKVEILEFPIALRTAPKVAVVLTFKRCLSLSLIFLKLLFIIIKVDLKGYLIEKNEIVILGMNGSIGQLFIQNPRVCAANFRLENDVGEMVSGLRATGASYIINSAAITDIKTCEADPDYAAQINVTGACNLFKAASAAGYKRFFQISTSHVYGTSTYFKRFGVCDDCDPKSTYGETKLEAERQLKKFSKEYKIALSIIRIFSVLSPTLRQGYLLPNLVLELNLVTIQL